MGYGVKIYQAACKELEDRRRAASGGPSTLEEAITQGLAAGEPKSALAKRLAKSFSLPKAQVYDKILQLG